MTFLFDENISQLIVDALKALGKPVAYLTDILPRGTDDIALFSRLAELSWFLVTQDKKIKRKKHELEALRRAGIGAFIFTGRAERDVDSMMMLVLKHFNEIQRLATATARPFIFGISDRALLIGLIETISLYIATADVATRLALVKSYPNVPSTRHSSHAA